MKRKTFAHKIKAIDVEARTIEHIITTEAPDRDGDIIKVDGWELDEFKKQPRVLFGHRHDIPPIGRNISIKQEGDALVAVTQFPPKDIYDLADSIFDLNRLGFIDTWSVGFDPIEFEMRKVEGETGIGMEFTRQKLLEYSSVPVPANIEAVNLAVQKGIVGDKTLKLLGWQCGGLIDPRTLEVTQDHTHDDPNADGGFIDGNVFKEIKEIIENNSLIDVLGHSKCITEGTPSLKDLSETIESTFTQNIAAMKFDQAHREIKHTLRKTKGAGAKQRLNTEV